MGMLSQLVSYFLESPRPVKRFLTLCYDVATLLTCMGFAIWLDNGAAYVWTKSDILVSFFTLVFSIAIFVRLGFYRAILRYIGVRAISVLFVGITLSTSIFSFFNLFIHNSTSLVLAVYYWCFLIISIGGSRLLFKSYMHSLDQTITPVAVFGAGAAGRQLVSALSHGNIYRPVFYLDDDYSIKGSEINGIKVYHPTELNEALAKHSVAQVFLALPSATATQRNNILKKLEPFPLKVKTIAGMEDIVTGKVKIEEVRDIDLEDLLGRESVAPNEELLESCISSKVVMVTGAGGSIGAELCRQIIVLKPKTLILYELSEYALYAIERELSKTIKRMNLNVELVALLGSVQHKGRLTKSMKAFKVQTVYHAAAYKHVPIVEHNIVEGIRNNVFGTLHAAKAAIQAGVQRFVLISTDKAVRPTNIMGASKRVAELVLQALNNKYDSTLFTMVRFGNVLGSSGSVVPLFREQIKSGGPVTVTHPDIIRYFMTIPEAAQLVIQAGAMGKGGDVFVLDMGEPVKIALLAERLIHLLGRTVKSEKYPNGDIEIQYSGLRPGEKLFEELLVGDNVEGTEHPRIMSANEEHLSWDDMKKALDALDSFCEEMRCDDIVQLLHRMPTGYNPQHSVCDLLWQHEEPSNDKVVQFKTLS
ncbi:polysaccharide biosynthesis protein [Pleionea litopenaei]|uniref:Nucleoside-diphosphate sugar epimerase/dehydratase n=1 Tax=Pleionea litopenaei TaxID=3070815 RepID=A0AA51X6H2_9GAMM|nr:nucleoside-diphosphate sugar epimerase/dehydratase [Pleionea sp. HL-JVS1]WMS87292.1 nucleoside-diphosphate sugar epimerase/dehydratase [Pleionea sp. HL-JVS1]